MSSITLRDFFEEKKKEWKLRLLAGEKGLDREVKTSEVSRPGLLLAGFETYFPSERIQLLGKTEMAYLSTLSPKAKREAIERLYKHSPPAMIFTRDLKPPKSFFNLSEERNIPLFSTPENTTIFARCLSEYLSYKLAPQMVLHGTLIDVYGVGILLTGRSGIGKSECALDLVARGHVLVADDLVRLVHYPPGNLTGSSAASDSSMKHFIEIRGVGLIDVYSLYGIRSVRDTKKVEIHVELIDWSEALDYERIGIKEETTDFLGVKIPYLRLPLNPGKNIAMILEVIAMSYHLKEKGISPAEMFEKILLATLEKKRNERENNKNKKA
jgi:HPr kinase/phosphorylase